ncbi:MAG: DinB family protein [Candidatus Acidiferrales bacterium]
MKKLLISATALALLLSASASRSYALSGPAAQSAAPATQAKDTTPPSYDMKPQALLDLDGMKQKFVALATAVPADKYTWRPAEGVRSIGEVFLHIANANYNIPNLTGTPLPAGFDPKTFEKSTTDKAQIIDALNKSFASAHAAIEAMTNADFNKPLPKLGPDANYGDVIYILVTHAHEHLGQSIAYARMNGVVPPWTAAAEAAAAAKKKAAPEE